MENISNLKISKSWQERLRDLNLYKLGICKKCILTTSVGVILGWALFLILNINSDNPLLLGTVLILALGFSIVWLGHIVAFYFRVFWPLSEARRNLGVAILDLSISKIDPNHVTGTFKQEKSGLSFEAIISGDNRFLSIDDIQGNNLLTLEEKDGIIDASILSGKMTINSPRLALSDAKSKKEKAIAIDKHFSQVVVSGDKESFRTLQDLPDYKLLPLLSKAIGKMGITGNRFPAILSLHILALGAFNYRQKQLGDNVGKPKSNDGKPDVVYLMGYPPGIREALQGSTSILDLFDDELDSCYPPFINDIYIFDPQYEEPWLPTCGTGCEDGSRRYPNRSDNCYGMCGDECECWSWICNDCCYHEGCANHDTWCRDDDLKCYYGFLEGFNC